MDVPFVHSGRPRPDAATPSLPGTANPAVWEQSAEDDVVKDELEVEGWPIQPRTLSRTSSQAFTNAAYEVLAFTLTLPYIVLAVYTAVYNNRLVSNADMVYRYIIQQGTTVLRNAFPYIFAFTVGQTVKNFAAWRLQCGVSLGDLEQLMGSTTVGGTITVHALLRPFNGLAI